MRLSILNSLFSKYIEFSLRLSLLEYREFTKGSLSLYLDSFLVSSPYTFLPLNYLCFIWSLTLISGEVCPRIFFFWIFRPFSLKSFFYPPQRVSPGGGIKPPLGGSIGEKIPFINGVYICGCGPP